MKKFVLILLTLMFTLTWANASDDFNWTLAGHIVVQDGGRLKPLDTFARETVSDVIGKDRYEGQHPVETYFRWMSNGESWVDMPLIYLPKGDLRKELELNDHQGSRFSIAELRGRPRLMQIVMEAQQANKAGEKLTFTQSKANEVLHKINTLSLVFSHELPSFAPPLSGDAKTTTWASMPEVLTAIERDSMSSNGVAPEFASLGLSFAGMYNAILDNRADVFNSSAELFVETQKTMLASQPEIESTLSWELLYNKLNPFFWARLLLLAAAIVFALSYKERFANLRSTAVLGMFSGLVFFSAGMIMRWIIGGRAPWSNMYESLMAIGWTMVIVALIYELVKRDRIFGLSGSLMGGIVLWLAHYASLDRGINPLVPALQSYWLVYHVITILTSYACLAIAMVIGHIVLISAVKQGGKITPSLSRMAAANLHVMQVGCVILIFGILLGAVWADSSWGRFWGWDPKETWALITWFVYIAFLHGRSAGWLNWKGLAFVSVAAFPVVVMTYYGVNFYLSGLHSYGAGSSPGIPSEAFGYLFLEIGFLSWVAMKLKGKWGNPTPKQPPSQKMSAPSLHEPAGASS
ncbi:MAG: cytochrome c biogenesis protein CcsA [Calditrichaeota bacterium]|nr:cytochrome c biogenesis protein CcsA [Calditrichota bacterium]MCB9391399.1 cytochrome c biogenesis protein CcsA [Calditrichota bacterium]